MAGTKAAIGDVVSDVLMPEAEMVGAFTARRKGARNTVASDAPSTDSGDVDRPGFGQRFGRRVEQAVKRATRPLGRRRRN